MTGDPRWKMILRKELKRRDWKDRKPTAAELTRQRAATEYQVRREGSKESESSGFLTKLEKKRLWRRERKLLARIRSYRKR